MGGAFGGGVFCGGVFCGGVVVFLLWCFCGVFVVVVVFFVAAWLGFCGGVFVVFFVVVFLWWCFL